MRESALARCKAPSTENAGWASGTAERAQLGASDLQVSPLSASTDYPGFEWNQIFKGKRRRVPAGSIVQHLPEVGTARWELPRTAVW